MPGRLRDTVQNTSDVVICAVKTTRTHESSHDAAHNPEVVRGNPEFILVTTLSRTRTQRAVEHLARTILIAERAPPAALVCPLVPAGPLPEEVPEEVMSGALSRGGWRFTTCAAGPLTVRFVSGGVGLRGSGEAPIAPAMYSGTARRRSAFEVSAVLSESLGVMPGCGSGLRRRVVVATMRSLSSVTPRTLRRDRARTRFRTAADGDCSTAQPSRAVPPRAAADPRARAPRPAGRRPAARPPSARSAG